MSDQHEDAVQAIVDRIPDAALYVADRLGNDDTLQHTAEDFLKEFVRAQLPQYRGLEDHVSCVWDAKKRTIDIDIAWSADPVFDIHFHNDNEEN